MTGEETCEMKNFLGFLGLCRRAGKAICGTPQVCLALQKGSKPPLVLYAAEASAATRKKIESKCAFYGVRAVALAVSPAALGAAVGKGGELAAVAVIDAGFADAMVKKLAAVEAPHSIGKDLSHGESKE